MQTKTKYALTNPIRRLRTKFRCCYSTVTVSCFSVKIDFCVLVLFSVTNHYCFMKIRCLSSFFFFFFFLGGGCFCPFYLTVFRDSSMDSSSWNRMLTRANAEAAKHKQTETETEQERKGARCRRAGFRRDSENLHVGLRHWRLHHVVAAARRQ